MPLALADKCSGSRRMKRDYRRSGRGRKRSSLTEQLGQLGDVGGDAPGLVVGEEVRNPGRFLRYIKVTAKERCSQMLRPATGFAEP